VARRGPIEKRVVLAHGVPVECRSNLAHETLSRFLAAAGRISDVDANAALSRSVARGVLLGEILIEEGRIEAGELQRLLQQSLARKLFDLFTWRDGEISFESGDFVTAAALKVKVPRLVLTGIERFVPQETIDAVIAPHVGVLLRRPPGTEELVEELRPTARERALLAALESPKRLDELLPVSGLDVEELSRCIWGLAVLGLVVPAERLPVAGRTSAPLPVPAAEISPAPATASPAAAAPAIAAEPTRRILPSEEAARIRERVATAFGNLRVQDPFDLLQAADATTVDEIRERYFAFAREFAPWQFETPELATAVPAAEELFAAGALAFARLSDSRERDALRTARKERAAPSSAATPAKSPDITPPRLPSSPEPGAAAPLAPPATVLPAPTHRSAGPTPASFRIDTDLLDPELQFKKGRALKEAQRWGPALQQFDFAADCDPQNGAYRAEAAHCRFLLAPSRMGPKALDELKEAQRIDPEAITPYLYAGEIAAQLARFDEAETFLRAAAKRLGTEDRRALDALRELAKKRKK
jgi:tetratricopeptide (TPR) repeat protein